MCSILVLIQERGPIIVLNDTQQTFAWKQNKQEGMLKLGIRLCRVCRAKVKGQVWVIEEGKFCMLLITP